MTKQDFIRKYWKKRQPLGNDGTYNINYLRVKWRQDEGNKIGRDELERLLSEIKNG